MAHYLHINYKAIGLPLDEPTPGEKAKQLIARCVDQNADSCEVISQVLDLCAPDTKSALKLLKKLVEVAASGLPFTEFYDKKQCHDIHTFDYKHKFHVIWRIRQGDVRVAFYYGEGRAVLLTGAFAKRQDRISTATKKLLEKEVKAYLDALADASFTPLEKD